MRKPSFFERLTGAISPEEYDDLFESDQPEHHINDPREREVPAGVVSGAAMHTPEAGILEEEEQEGELAVDVYETPEAIVVKALVAGVHPNNLDISLTRDMVTIRGTREDQREVEDDGYFYRELYWGAFSRTILLPEEVEVDEADASSNFGILIIRLPKINKAKKTKLKVKAR